MDENKTEADQAQVSAPEPSSAPASRVSRAETMSSDAAPAGPSFRERMAITLEPARKQLGAAWNRVSGWLSGGSWVYGLIALLVVAALLLPPISLPHRLGLVGYTRLNANNRTLNHPDGLTIHIGSSEGGSALVGTANSDVEGSIRLKVTSVPRLEFLEGNAGSALLAARDAMPPVLELKSPYYQIDARGSGPATLEVVIPNDAEPWMTLDLYSWNGSEWEWVGGQLDEETETLILQVSQVPQSLAVVQTSAVVPAIGTTSATHPTGETAQTLTQVAMPGLYLGTDGALLGQTPTLAEANPEALLLIRNWQEGQLLSLSPLSDLLGDEAIQEDHIAAIVETATEAGAVGVALDYRGVSTEQEQAFVDFITALADALHEQNVRLEVRVAAPTYVSGEWETAGYDWTALGEKADAILVPFPTDPAAYAQNGEVQRLLHWAVSQVNRYKLRPIVSSLSVDTDGEEVTYVGLQEALAPFGQVQPPNNEALEPGAEVVFTLAGQVSSIMRNEAAGTYAITYRTEEEEAHTVWLGTPSFLARKLDYALRYHLGGVVINDILDTENMAGVLDAVASYRSAADQPQPTTLEVEWTVNGPETSTQRVTLTQPDFRWTAPSEPGTYTVAAVIAGVDRGSVAMTVASPTPTPTPTLTTAVDTDAAVTDEEAGCLRATFVEDVTVPDGTHFEKGEAFVKTWKLRNSGTCDWPEDTVLVRGYSDVGGPETHQVGAVAVGETVEISIDLAAPDADGNFDGLWKLMTGGQEILGG
ncbi:MAG: NBR1-Ig-like domain-containing protein, partial [Anaerolineae bacterium]